MGAFKGGRANPYTAVATFDDREHWGWLCAICQTHKEGFYYSGQAMASYDEHLKESHAQTA